MRRKGTLLLGAASVIVAGLAGGAASALAQPSGGATAPAAIRPAPEVATATPIKHLVVIYDENISFDHYFATYPNATNPPGEPAFTALPDTPVVSNLASAHLLTNNPNFTNPENGAGATNPFRLDRSEAATSDQDHGYTAEQLAYDHGKADLFPKYTGRAEAGAAGV
ncbi:MAG: alkaline phosphatase family protein, partial [Acetobacteraceae bacterium]